MRIRSRFLFATPVVVAGALLISAFSLDSRIAEAGALHLHLTRAEPRADTTVSNPPSQLTLHFSEAVKVAVTAVRVTGPDSAQVALEKLTLGSGKVAPVVAKVSGNFKAGKQKVVWRTQGADGHTITGEYSFTFKPLR